MLPTPLATISSGEDYAKKEIEKIEDLTLFLHEQITHEHTIIQRTASLNKVVAQFIELEKDKDNFVFHLSFSNGL